MKSSEEGTCGGKDGHRRLHALTTLVILMIKNILASALTLVSAVGLICWAPAAAFCKSYEKNG